MKGWEDALWELEKSFTDNMARMQKMPMAEILALVSLMMDSSDFHLLILPVPLNKTVPAFNVQRVKTVSSDRGEAGTLIFCKTLVPTDLSSYETSTSRNVCLCIVWLPADVTGQKFILFPKSILRE